jgi:hypothetical protein
MNYLISPDILKILNYMYSSQKIFTEPIAYTPASIYVRDIRQKLCYLKDVEGQLCYDKLEPFAFLAVEQLLHENSGQLGKSKKIRILSLDGGRGLLEAAFLVELEKRTKKKVHIL